MQNFSPVHSNALANGFAGPGPAERSQLTMEGETGMSFAPPTFQLTALPSDPNGNETNGPEKKKSPSAGTTAGVRAGIVPSPVPTFDHPPGANPSVIPEPKAIPQEVLDQVPDKIEGVEDLEIAVDLLIVHSPCYSAEIYAIMQQVNQGEIDLDTGVAAIRERILYLLNNEFKNADGEANGWAETNKGDGTVSNEDNMGADWYHMGRGTGPSYIALTDWNNAADPSQGGNNYNVIRYQPTAEPVEGTPEYFQEYGNPLVSPTGGGTGVKTKARNQGNSIDVTFLQVIFGFLGSFSGGKSKSFSEKAKDVAGSSKTIAEGANDYAENQEKERDLEREAAQKAEEEKGNNTRVEFQELRGNQSGALITEVSRLQKVYRYIDDNPDHTFKTVSTKANDPAKPYFSVGEVNKKIKAHQEALKEERSKASAQ